MNTLRGFVPPQAYQTPETTMSMQTFYSQLKSSPTRTALQSALRTLCEPTVTLNAGRPRDGEWSPWTGAKPGSES